jgi:tetratricopeptide (TPR) repeat protein
MSLSDSTAYAAAREILRYRNHPQRLRANAFVRSWWMATQAGDVTASDDEALVWALNRRLRELIAGMPDRHSELLRRCDLEGEQHRSAMRALALSERHFYRERRSAITALGHLLKVHPAKRRQSSISLGHDRLSLGLARADALERAGHTDDALGVLLLVRTGAADDQTIRVDVRLAEVNRDAGRFVTAARHARLARERSDGDCDTSAELDGLSATIAWQSGDIGLLSHDAMHARLTQLRAGAGRRPALIPHALSDALEMSAESTLEAGDWPRALALFEEAYASLPRVPAPRNDVEARSLIWIATARSWIVDGLKPAAEELDRAYGFACAQSLPREATLALGRLCQLYDLTGNTRKALELATTQLEPVASELVGDWRAGVHLDIASTFVSAGRLAEARNQLALARAHAPQGSFAYAAAMMQECEIDLAARDVSAAIARATAAIGEMERLGRSRHVGVALAVRAEALWLSGNTREGATQMLDALDLMARCAHPLRLAAQYRRAVRVTGDRRHGRLAREIWSSYATRLA